MTSSPIILVTGANRGLGLAIIRSLAAREPRAVLCLASRSREAGGRAVEELRGKGVQSTIDVVELDVTSDDSIRFAGIFLAAKYQRIDVLVDNAGIAASPKADLSDFRAVYNSILDTNVTSIARLTHELLPLLKAAPDPRVINVSSARASVSLSASGKLPPTACIPYSISKTALNVFTLEMAKAYGNMKWYCASPGHLRTAFNNYRGEKDPMEGARVVVELALDESMKYESGFWQYEEDAMSQVAW